MRRFYSVSMKLYQNRSPFHLIFSRKHLEIASILAYFWNHSQNEHSHFSYRLIHARWTMKLESFRLLSFWFFSIFWSPLRYKQPFPTIFKQKTKIFQKRKKTLSIFFVAGGSSHDCRNFHCIHSNWNSNYASRSADDGRSYHMDWLRGVAVNIFDDGFNSHSIRHWVFRVYCHLYLSSRIWIKISNDLL